MAAKELERSRRHWDRSAPSYDDKMAFADRKFFGDTREWICRQAAGDVLEVAVGTGLNLGSYPGEVQLTGIDLSQAMLDRARQRAKDTGRTVDLGLGDAQRLEFADASFDTVVCTFSLCAVPDARAALGEMIRVLRPGGLLLLADHVVSSSAPVRAIQWLVELVTIRTGGEHFRRRPMDHVRAAGLQVEHTDRFKLGIVERLAARKPMP